MNPQLPAREIEKLLGGYATGTLTAEEQRALFDAALRNQSLFDALADEQALKEVLNDPASRAHLLRALGERRESPAARLAAWIRRPSMLALGSAVTAAVILFVAVQPGKLRKQAPAAVAMREQAPALPPVEAPQTASQPERRLVKPEKRAGKKPERAPVLQRAEPEDSIARNAPPATPAPPPPPPPPPAAAPAAAPQFAAPSIQATLQRTEVQNARALYYSAEGPPVMALRFGESAEKKAKARGALGGFAPAEAGRTNTTLGQRVPGIRYSILKRLPDGILKEVNPAAPIDAGSAVRLRLEANQEGDIAVLRREPDSGWTLWGGAHVRVGEPFDLPAGNSLLTVSPGESHFFVRFARVLQPEARSGQVADTPHLLREQSGTSVYVVNPARPPDGGLQFEFTVSVK